MPSKAELRRAKKGVLPANCGSFFNGSEEIHPIVLCKITNEGQQPLNVTVCIRYTNKKNPSDSGVVRLSTTLNNDDSHFFKNTDVDVRLQCHLLRTSSIKIKNVTTSTEEEYPLTNQYNGIEYHINEDGLCNQRRSFR